MGRKHLLLIIAIVFMVASCEKQDEITQNKQSFDFPSLDHIAFSVDDNTLKFRTLSDYDLMLEYLQKLPENVYPDFEKYINLRSLRQDINDKGTDFPIDNEYMLTLLNPQYSIIIDEYRFQFIIINKVVEVEDLSFERHSDGIQSFSWEQDVVDIVFFNGSPVLKGTMSACPGDADWYTWTASNNTTIDARLDYDNIPLFYELKAKITKTAFRPGVQIYVGVGASYLGSSYPTYYDKKSGGCYQFYGDQDGGESSSYIISIVKSRLEAYYSYARFTSYDYYVLPEVWETQWAYLACHRDDISCD